MHHSSTDASLFSTSLPVHSHVKLNIHESDQSGQSLDNGFTGLDKLCLEDEVKDLVEDTTDPIVIGSFLPGDEDELLAGRMDDFDLGGLPTQLEDLDDDIFRSGGGLEIELESQEKLVTVSRMSTSDSINGSSLSPYGFANGMGTISGEHPYGEHPSRTLFVRNINSNVEDSELRLLFEQYGDIRTLYTACKHRGFVMISYYDIRAARTAMRVLQNKPLRRRKLDIHFSIPKDNPSEKDINQGTLVVFNLDPSVSNDDLRQIFGAYGEVKEIRETPHKRHHKFIEFYDVRAAEAALKALNRSDIAGKRIKLEPSRPGGARRSLMLQLTQEQDQDEAQTLQQQVGSPIANSPPGSWLHYGSPIDQNSLHGYIQPTNLGQLSPVGSSHVPGLASIIPSHASCPVKIAPIGKDLSRMSPVSKVIPVDNATRIGSYRKHPFATDSKLSSSPGPLAFGSSKSSSVGTLSGPQFLWGSPTIQSEQVNCSAWSPSSTGHQFSPTGQGVQFPYSSIHKTYLGSHHHHVGSAPSGIQLERHLGFFPESPKSSSYIKHGFGISNFIHNNVNLAMNMDRPESMKMGVAFAGNITESGTPSSRITPMSRNGPIYFGNGSFTGMGDGIVDCGRSRRADCGSQMDNKKQYQLDLEKIINGEDSRTTLMIKNIPNKYTSKMLLAAIDETHKGTYNFLYLPIDFKNKCNVGYAFINMVSPSHIITFYEAFNGKKWEKFNSEKVASLAFARIQGKPALISHFHNSSLMNEDKRCRPIVFQYEGQEIGDLEHVPSANLNVFILRPDGSYAGDSLDSPKGYDKM